MLKITTAAPNGSGITGVQAPIPLSPTGKRKAHELEQKTIQTKPSPRLVPLCTSTRPPDCGLQAMFTQLKEFLEYKIQEEKKVAFEYERTIKDLQVQVEELKNELENQKTQRQKLEAVVLKLQKDLTETTRELPDRRSPPPSISDKSEKKKWNLDDPSSVSRSPTSSLSNSPTISPKDDTSDEDTLTCEKTPSTSPSSTPSPTAFAGSSSSVCDIWASQLLLSLQQTRPLRTTVAIHPTPIRTVSSGIVVPKIPDLDPDPDKRPNKKRKSLHYGKGDSDSEKQGLDPGLSPDSVRKKSSGSSRKRRGHLPSEATALLKNWLWQHNSHPYPSEEEKQGLATRTGLTLTQINNWFTNARRRILKKPFLNTNSKGK